MSDVSSLPDFLHDPLGVVAINSPAYVLRVLECFAAGRVVVPLRSEDDNDRKLATGVVEVEKPEAGWGWIAPPKIDCPGEKAAQVSFTSGTEGTPKGVVLSHGALADVVERLIEVMEIDSSIREYVGIPVYHSFGFGRCRVIGAVGGRAYLPENGFNPLEIADLLRQGEINAISAVPSLWRAVLEAPDMFVGTAGGVRWIEIGSQFMTAAEKEALRKLFPRAIIVQHYGLTEASRSTFLRIDQATRAELDSVGRPTGKVEVEISDSGRIKLRGPHLAWKILDAGRVSDASDEQGWLETQDRGELTGGVLHYLGRSDDVINCGGIKLSPERLETALRARALGTGEFAIARVPDRLRGDGILLALTGQSDAERRVLIQELLAETQRQGVHARGAVRVCTVAELPRTATGKVQRRRLAEEHQDALLVQHELDGGSAQQGSGGQGSGEPQTEREAELLTIWKEALGAADLRVNESFYDLGGDSVTALSVVVRMSRAGLDQQTCRRILQGATIRELAASADSPSTGSGRHSEYLSTMMVNALRGVLVAAVVLGHWSGGALSRLPERFSLVQPLLAPFFAFGTPGFAIVFGIGFGYLYLERTKSAPRRVWAAMRLGTVIVGTGVLALAGMRFLTVEEEFSYDSFFVRFYSVLAFYFFAIPTVPLWARMGHWVKPSWRPAFFGMLAVLSYGVSAALYWGLNDVEADGFLRFMRLMLVAKYNYFAMMSGVLVGVAVGDYARRRGELPRAPVVFAISGLVVLLVGIAIGVLVGEIELLVTWPSPLRPWKWVVYLGCILLMLSSLWSLRTDYDERNRVVRMLLERLATVGQLALPLYVVHEMMVPLKGLLVSTGLPDRSALGLTLALFVGITWYMVQRVFRLFHSS